MRNLELQCLFDLVEDGVLQFTRNATSDTILKEVSKVESEGLSKSNVFTYIKLKVVNGDYNLFGGDKLSVKVPAVSLLSNISNIFGIQIDREDGYITLPVCLLTNPIVDTDILLDALVEFLKAKLYGYYIGNNLRVPDMGYSVLNINISDIAKEMYISDIQQVRLKANTLPCEFRNILSDQTCSESGFITIDVSDILKYVKMSDNEFDSLIYKLRSIFCSKTWSVRNCQYEPLLELLKEATAYQYNHGIRLLFKLSESMLQPIYELFKIISEDIEVSSNTYSMIEVNISDSVVGRES